MPPVFIRSWLLQQGGDLEDVDSCDVNVTLSVNVTRFASLKVALMCKICEVSVAKSWEAEQKKFGSGFVAGIAELRCATSNKDGLCGNLL